MPNFLPSHDRSVERFTQLFHRAMIARSKGIPNFFLPSHDRSVEKYLKLFYQVMIAANVLLASLFPCI